jgi:N-acetylmuramoyl-L-alanine amidase
MRLTFHRRVAPLTMVGILAAGAPVAHVEVTRSALAEPTRPPARPWPMAGAPPHSKPDTPSHASSDRAARADETAIIANAATPELPHGFRELAKRSGEPQIPGLTVVYLHPLGNPAHANPWRNIIVHQTEGPAGSAKGMALAQAKNPTKRGVTVWVETDGTVYWSTAEDVIPTHGDGANRNDNKYLDNSKTYRTVIKTNSIGVEFVGNYPDVAKPPTREQAQAWLVLVRFLQERYDIPAENIYAHNWIDFKDHRYCEGCELAMLARKLAYEPGKSAANGAE